MSAVSAVKEEGRKRWHTLRKGVQFFGTKARAVRQKRLILLNKIKKGLPFPRKFLKTLSDVDIGSKKKKEEEKRNFILMVAGIGLAVVVLLIWMFKK